MRKHTKSGFSLAEVLLALVILGVVIRMTIIPMINDTRDKHYKESCKKAYTELVRISEKVMESKSITSYTSAFSDSTSIMNSFSSQMKVMKTCTTLAQGNCWHNSGSWYYLNGTAVTSVDYPAMILIDGTLMRFNLTSAPCNENMTNHTRCAAITVDINGFKKPNKYGMDIFDISVLEDKLIPLGIPGSTSANTCSKSSTGLSCAADYILSTE